MTDTTQTYTAPALVAETITQQLREAGYALAELPRGADLDLQLDALTGALGVLCVVQARQAEQTAAIFDTVAVVAELAAQLAPMAEQLAAGGPGALLSLIGLGRK